MGKRQRLVATLATLGLALGTTSMGAPTAPVPEPVSAAVADSRAATASPATTQADVPSPESFLGFRVGADFHLASYDEALDYFRRLDAASDRIELRHVGETTFGLPWYIALISSPENLANVERYREIAQRLAHPEGLTDAEARELAAEGKAIVHIDGGLHSTEVAHAQHNLELAYDLVTAGDDPDHPWSEEIRSILDEVVLVLWFSINPDGQNMVVEWYESNLGTPYEVAPMPRLYQAYIGHDNNRDGYMLNMIESRVVTREVRRWEPQILYNHHQSSPFPTRIWIPPFAEPISTFVHPLMWRTVNLIGMNMAQALEERGQEGATHMGTGFDNWYPGFIDHANNFHNVASFLTETGLYRYATPHFYTIADFPERRRDLRPESLYPSPWKGGWWRLRDAVDYMLTASFSVLDLAAKYRKDLLYNRYQAGRDVIATHREEPPYAYFVPREQRDPVAAAELLRRLAFNGIEIHELTEPLTFERIDYPAGTWVIPMDQEFALFVRQLFTVQEYPDLREFPEGPPDQPFDVAGWTLPYQMGLRVVEASVPLGDEIRERLRAVRGEPVATGAGTGSDTGRGADAGAEGAVFDSVPGPGFDTHPVAAGIRPLPGRTTGSGPALAVNPAQNNSFRAVNAAWEAGGTVRFDPGQPGNGEGGQSGRWVITGVDDATMNGWVEDLALQAKRTRATGTEVRRPRIALYRPWQASIDEGWTRWLLERYDFDFTNIYNADFRAGALGERFDVIILADHGADTILEGYRAGSVPPRYAGGIGREGVRALDEFVRGGGTLVTLNSSSRFAIDELHLPVEDVVAGKDREEFYVSGSILAVTVDPAHPVMSGMPADAKLMVHRSPVFTTKEGFEGSVFAKYQEAGSPLLSGYQLGEEHMQGYAAGVDVTHGDGRVVLLGFRPQWRAQSFATFKVLFNAALYDSAVAGQATPTPGFWAAPPIEKKESDGKETGTAGEERRR